MAVRRGTKAWVVRWAWSGPHAAIDRQIAAILRPQLGETSLLRIVDALYAARQYEPDEMLAFIRPNWQPPYRAHLGTIGRVPWAGEIICGHNPYLVARLARVWATQDGRIEWEDDP
jgi:hypothetical protein